MSLCAVPVLIKILNDKTMTSLNKKNKDFSQSLESNKSLLTDSQKIELDQTIIEHELSKSKYFTFDKIKKSISNKKK